MSIEICSNCKFWEKVELEDEVYGICHRYPPQILGRIEGRELDIVLPCTDEEDWCGEFQKR
jgi:hypothetical protein